MTRETVPASAVDDDEQHRAQAGRARRRLGLAAGAVAAGLVCAGCSLGNDSGLLPSVTVGPASSAASGEATTLGSPSTAPAESVSDTPTVAAATTANPRDSSPAPQQTSPFDNPTAAENAPDCAFGQSPVPTIGQAPTAVLATPCEGGLGYVAVVSDHGVAHVPDGVPLNVLCYTVLNGIVLLQVTGNLPGLSAPQSYFGGAVAEDASPGALAGLNVSACA